MVTKKTSKKTAKKKATKKTAAKSGSAAAPKSAKKVAKAKKSGAAKPAKADDAPAADAQKTPPKEEPKKKSAAKKGRGKRGAAAQKSATLLARSTGKKRSLSLAPGVMVSTPGETRPSRSEKTVEKFRKLTKKELSNIESQLRELRDELLSGLRKEMADSRMRSGSMSPDPVDQAAEAYDDDVSFEIASTSDEELEQIHAALEKIKKGSYGLCEGCEAQISPSRLKILPYATACVSCRGEKERLRKRDPAATWAFVADDTSSDDD